MSRGKQGSRSTTDDGLEDIFADALRSVEKHARHRGPESTEHINLEETVEEIIVPEDLLRAVESHEEHSGRSSRSPEPLATSPSTGPSLKELAALKEVSTLKEQLQTLQRERLLAYELTEKLKGRTAELARESRRLESELEAKNTELQKGKEQLTWLNNELENTRKRHTREKNELERFGNEKLLKDLLPVLDNLERALSHAKERPEVTVLQEGVQMTVTQFQNALRRHGVQRVPLEPGAGFDPTYHEAMMHEESAVITPNHVVRELQAGYTHHERLLRASLVTVARPLSRPVEPATPVSSSPASGETPS